MTNTGPEILWGFGSATEEAALNKLDSLSYRSLGTNLPVSWLRLFWGH